MFQSKETLTLFCFRKKELNNTNRIINLSDSLCNKVEDKIVDNLVTDKESFYKGKMAGDVASAVEGVIVLGKGLITIAAGITIGGAGAGITFVTGGAGVIVGAPAIAVSVPVVAVGAAESSVGAGIMYSSMDSYRRDKIKAETSDIDNGKLKEEGKELDRKIKDAEEGVGKAELGHDFGKMGKYVEHPNIEVDWSKFAEHGLERMEQRGVTQDMVNDFVKNGKVLSQNEGNKFAFITKEGVAVVSKDGKLITTWGKDKFDDNMKEIVKMLWGE